MRQALAAALRELRTTGDLSTVTRLYLADIGVDADALINRYSN